MASAGELMRSDCKPCSRLARHTASIFTVGGSLASCVICRITVRKLPLREVRDGRLVE